MRGTRIAIVGLILAVAACGASDDTDDEPPVASAPSPDVEAVDQSDPIQAVSEWPSSVSADVPQLPGTILQVVPGDSRTRIFYEDLDPQDIADYADRLAADGWEVAYVVYESATDPEASKERAARGEYDLVTAIRGDYRLKIEPPTLDIDVLSGATDPPPETTTAAIDWPVGVPEIPGATVDGFHPSIAMTVVIGTFSTGSVEEYADVLRADGFVDVPDDGFDDAVLTNGTITIRLLFVQPDGFNFRIEPNS